MSEGWWALGGVVIGAIASGTINLMLQRRQFKHEKEMHVLQNQGSVGLVQTKSDTSY